MNVTDHPMKSWARLCKSRSIDLYGLLKDKRQPIWFTRFRSEQDREIEQGACRLCRRPVEIKHYMGRWFAKLCICVRDTEHRLTAAKLRCFYADGVAEGLIAAMNEARVRKFTNNEAYWIANGYSDGEASAKVREVQQARSSTAARNRRGKSHLSPGSREFWLARGFTDEEARRCVTRNQTRDRAFFVRRYGEEEGERRWSLKTERWQQAMAKLALLQASNIANTFVARLGDHVPRLISEKVVRAGKRTYRVDCFDPNTNSVIEFFGDYWHANPAKYREEDAYSGHRKRGSVREIWDKDARKLTTLTAAGYHVKVIWETDYRLGADAVVNDCLRFLGEMNGAIANEDR